MTKTKFDVRYKNLLLTGYEIVRDISNKDLDDMKYSGAYYGFNIINAPDENYSQIIITRHNENWVVQECKDYIDRIYLRSYKDNEWSNWTQLEVAHDCDEPDKEFIIVERPHTHALSTPQSHGFMSAQDKAKLDAFSINLDENYEIIVPDHVHQDYEERFLTFLNKLEELEDRQLECRKEALDARYIPVLSYGKPAHHDTIGQVWIDINI